jgi:pimeloyl-ACP methyl ester carboxylesterase
MLIVSRQAVKDKRAKGEIMDTTSNGVRISYDDHGMGEPALLLLTGWCANRTTMYSKLIAECRKSRRTLALDWRGHGLSADAKSDFGIDDLVQDALSVIEASGAQYVVPVATAHAGWVAIELRRRLAERIPKIILLEWMVFEAPPPFLEALQALQDPEQWEQAREQLFSMWLTGVDNPDVIRLVHEMADQGFEMWARAGREISASYRQQGAPLQALSHFDEPIPALHLYAQEPPGYLTAQQAFAAEHPWFSVRRVEARSHFPMTEVPDVVAKEIEYFVAS